MVSWKVIAALVTVAIMYMLAHPGFQTKKEPSKWANLGWFVMGWFYIYVTLVWIGASVSNPESELSIVKVVTWLFVEKK